MSQQQTDDGDVPMGGTQDGGGSVGGERRDVGSKKHRTMQMFVMCCFFIFFSNLSCGESVARSLSDDTLVSPNRCRRCDGRCGSLQPSHAAAIQRSGPRAAAAEPNGVTPGPVLSASQESGGDAKHATHPKLAMGWGHLTYVMMRGETLLRSHAKAHTRKQSPFPPNFSPTLLLLPALTSPIKPIERPGKEETTREREEEGEKGRGEILSAALLLFFKKSTVKIKFA